MRPPQIEVDAGGQTLAGVTPWSRTATRTPTSTTADPRRRGRRARRAARSPASCWPRHAGRRADASCAACSPSGLRSSTTARSRLRGVHRGRRRGPLDGRPVHLQVDGDYIGEVTEARSASRRGRWPSSPERARDRAPAAHSAGAAAPACMRPVVEPAVPRLGPQDGQRRSAARARAGSDGGDRGRRRGRGPDEFGESAVEPRVSRRGRIERATRCISQEPGRRSVRLVVYQPAPTAASHTSPCVGATRRRRHGSARAARLPRRDATLSRRRRDAARGAALRPAPGVTR